MHASCDSCRDGSRIILLMVYSAQQDNDHLNVRIYYIYFDTRYFIEVIDHSSQLPGGAMNSSSDIFTIFVPRHEEL